MRMRKLEAAGKTLDHGSSSSQKRSAGYSPVWSLDFAFTGLKAFTPSPDSIGSIAVPALLFIQHTGTQHRHVQQTVQCPVLPYGALQMR